MLTKLKSIILLFNSPLTLRSGIQTTILRKNHTIEDLFCKDTLFSVLINVKNNYIKIIYNSISKDSFSMQLTIE